MLMPLFLQIEKLTTSNLVIHHPAGQQLISSCLNTKNYAADIVEREDTLKINRWEKARITREEEYMEGIRANFARDKRATKRDRGKDYAFSTMDLLINEPGRGAVEWYVDSGASQLLSDQNVTAIPYLLTPFSHLVNRSHSTVVFDKNDPAFPCL